MRFTLIFAALYDETGNTLTLRSTANNGGYWMNTKGVVVTWNTNGFALYVEPTLYDGDVTLTSGNNESAVAIDQTYTFPMFYITPDTTTYYQLDIIINVIEKPDVNDSEFKEVAVWPIEIEALTGGGYPIEQEPTIDLAVLEETIGTRAPTFLAWTAPDDDGNKKMTDDYSCTPYPGFWMNADGYASVWQSSSPVGVCYLANGAFDLYRYPGTPKNGDVWNGKFILLNDANGQYVTIDLTIHFFDTIISVETVGEEDIDLLAGDEDMNQIDIAPMLEALDITPEAINDGPTIMGYLPNGKWSNVIYSDAGLIFKDNKVVEDVDYNTEPEKCDFLVGFYAPEEGTISTFFADRSNAFQFNGTYKCDLAVTANDKAYIYHITIYDDEAWVGVNSLKTDTQKSNAIFNLAGQRVSKATKGVYIVGGKKVAVK